MTRLAPRSPRSLTTSACLGSGTGGCGRTTQGPSKAKPVLIGADQLVVALVHTPVRPLPQPRYNVVQFDYAYGGGYTSQDMLSGRTPIPYPGTDIVYVLDLPDPPVFALAQAFAQKVANILSRPWYSGSGTLHKVNPGNLPAGS